jgi:hypothetical protein
MEARYPGKCTSCGGAIHTGQKIFWERGNGARHVKCPEQKQAPPEQIEPAVPEFMPEQLAMTVTIYWSDGEYLSAFAVGNGGKEMEQLGLAHYVSGWGYHADGWDWATGHVMAGEGHNALGETFTLADAVEFARPKLEAKLATKTAKKAQKQASDVAKFEEAKRTGKPVILARWSEDCNDPREECDIDNLTRYAMPDGTTKITRSHTW